MVAGMAMSLSSVSVVVSSLLLKFYQPPGLPNMHPLSLPTSDSDMDLEANLEELRRQPMKIQRPPRKSGESPSGFVEGVKELLGGSPRRGYRRVLEDEEDGEENELLEKVELA